ncbi:type IV pilus secretin PilQ [Desulfococcaceae bacterium OttesenSCG-928-F15]|nr:type IV pilus secretin PilQ [Desulfococcaceae bacterium OttesenSCG-928-F15]
MRGLGSVQCNKVKALIAGVVVFGFVTACAPGGSDSTGSLTGAEKPNQIQKIDLAMSEGTNAIVISSTEALAYTAIKEQNPSGLRLYFANASLASDALPQETSGGPVLSVVADQISDTDVRLGFVFNEDVAYDMQPGEESGLRIVFAPRPSEADGSLILASENSEDEKNDEITSTSERTPTLLKVQITEEDGTAVAVLANVPVRNVESFAIENPPRIVLDIPGLFSPFEGMQRLAVKDNKDLRSVRHYAYPDKVRIVLDMRKDATKYAGYTTQDGYLLVLGENVNVPVAAPDAAVPEEQAETTVPVPPAPLAPLVSAPSEKATTVKDLRFIALPQGRSMLLVETEQPVQYEVFEEGADRLSLRLAHTQIPAKHKRPLVTTGFESALDYVLPITGDGQSSSLLLTLREAVPYTITQRGNFLEVSFERSKVQPVVTAPGLIASMPAQQPETQKAATPENVSQAPVATTKKPSETSAPPGDQPTSISIVMDEEGRDASEYKQFSGTPISIDFYNADIRNVFRILQHISGQNFAIDKDVTGRVTMSLENPVPWDQILSLVLRMNGLDMVYEGSIIRIATLATIRKEAQERQEILRARRENEKQAVALTPLTTEYILINYSNVTSEILPHIRSILSERGKANADTRNNQLIITDTPEVIVNAKQIIRRIDKITPQVVIEARIVEANDRLNKALGVSWNASTSAKDASEYATRPSGDLGGQYGYNMSLNGPEGAGTIGLHFARIAGSPLALNAQLQLSEEKGDSRIVSSPRIVTLDNKKASITQGFEYPYTTRNSDGDVTTSFKKIEMKLEVTPHITADNRIAMKVTIDKDDIYENTSDGPALQTKEIETELLVNDGDTIVIGGVLVTRQTDSKNQVPFFSKIPLIGWLFKSTNTSNTKEELLIFLTPRIMQLEPAKM